MKHQNPDCTNIEIGEWNCPKCFDYRKDKICEGCFNVLLNHQSFCTRNLELNKIICGDALEELKKLPDESIDMCITSPPYWGLRDYGYEGQMGLEPTFQEFIQKLCEVFDEVKRVLKPGGTCFVNLGDSYAGTRQMGTSGNGTGSTTLSGPQATYKNDKGNGYNKLSNGELKEKSLAQIPSRFALAMTDRGWILRNTIIWHKKNAMPSSVLDRFSNKYEQVFFFVKSKKYYFDVDSIRIPYELDEKRPNGITREREFGYDSKYTGPNAEAIGTRRPAGSDYERNSKGKNPGDVWTLVSEPFPEAHFATFPTKLLIQPIKAGCPERGIVLDPFLGSGTTALAAKRLGRNYIGIEKNPEYVKMAEKRLAQGQLL